ncbi:MAG: ribose 5-phosphate isomerase B [Clostridia bacterium]|nr:ribose 5-phosphate isomerase B [Clostridia bacterium]
MDIRKIIIGCDHGGLNLKNAVIAHLNAKGIAVEDVGTYTPASCNYPDYAHKVCEKVQDGTYELGILICGTGIGMSMAANKHVGIRAAACENTFSARMTRLHNNANVLCMGERVIGPGLACDIVDLFISTDFEGGRHQIRVDLVNGFDRH